MTGIRCKNAEEVNTGKMPVSELGVKAIDAKTLEITLKAPSPYFLQLLTHTTGLPVNAKAIAVHGNDWVKPGQMVSNGPSTWILNGTQYLVVGAGDTLFAFRVAN